MESDKSVRATDVELKDRLVAINRVTKVTKGGRHFSFSAIVVVGDEQSIVGHGLGKANEVTEAISKAVEEAKKNLKRIAVINDTLPHAIKSKYSGAQVFFEACICWYWSYRWWSNACCFRECGYKKCFGQVSGFFKST